MSAGYNLKSGNYKNGKVSDEELWEAVAFVFTSASRNESSYKFGFLKAIIDCLPYIDSDYKLSFDTLFKDFANTYWSLVLKYELKQKRKDSSVDTLLERIFRSVTDEYAIDKYVSFADLDEEIVSSVTHQTKQSCKRYVVGALYDDTKALIYGFSKKEEWIQIKPEAYTFLNKHKKLIEKLNYFEWARFLEKINNDLPNENTETRLIKYREIFADEFEGDGIKTSTDTSRRETALFNDVFPEKIIVFPSIESAGVTSIELLFKAEEIEDEIVADSADGQSRVKEYYSLQDSGEESKRRSLLKDNTEELIRRLERQNR